MRIGSQKAVSYDKGRTRYSAQAQGAAPCYEDRLADTLALANQASTAARRLVKDCFSQVMAKQETFGGFVRDTDQPELEHNRRS